MVCKACNRQWDAQEDMRFCPYCGAELPVPKKIKTITDAIEQMVAERGTELLQTPRVLYSLVIDLVHGYEREKKLLHLLVGRGYFAEICVVLGEQDAAVAAYLHHVFARVRAGSAENCYK